MDICGPGLVTAPKSSGWEGQSDEAIDRNACPPQDRPKPEDRPAGLCVRRVCGGPRRVRPPPFPFVLAIRDGRARAPSDHLWVGQTFRAVALCTLSPNPSCPAGGAFFT